MADEKMLSRYACDYCWKKKLRCSREKPKCKHCSFWTSGCIYSREQSGCKYTRTPTKESHNQQHQAESPASTPDLSQFPPKTVAGDNSPGLSNGTLSSIASTFSQARHVLEHNQVIHDSELMAHSTGVLTELYIDFEHSTYDHDKIKAAVRKMRRENETFFVPTEPVGQMFLQCFLAAVRRGFPLLSQPSEETLLDLVFRPSSVKERGWVLMFNTILATASTQAPNLSEYTFHLRWNAWLAADEASLFLEPTTLNIQALTIFAVHGQDLVTPSLCWNLISQACRMVQAVKLLLPSKTAPKNSKVYSRNLCLFWSLFIIDKSLSLSFGCPPILPSALYRNIALPSPEQLSEYRPHLRSADYGSGIPSHVEFFGAFYFVQCTKLAMIMGDISDYFLDDRSHGRHLDLKKKLDGWIAVVQQNQLLHTDLADATDSQRTSVRLGFTHLKYQYHHLVVTLTRSDKSCREICLSSARAAIILLKGLVAHSEEVFNGIIWQQLYMPFTPFFVLFGEVVTNPTAKTSVDDLQLFRQIVLYFFEFQKYHASAVKLEKVAETFTKTAEAYVRHVFRKQSGIGNGTHLLPNTQAVLSAPLTYVVNSSKASEAQTTVAPDFDQTSTSCSPSDPMDYQLPLDETSSLNLSSLFELFSYQGDDAAALEQLKITESLQGFRPHTANTDEQTHSTWQVLETGQYLSLRDVEMNGRSQFSNCTFDWFALENYTM